MDRRAIFAEAFRGEVEKIAMEKEALLPLLAGGILAGGASLIGMTGFGKPKDIVSRKYFSAKRDIPKMFGYFGGLGATASGGLGSWIGPEFAMGSASSMMKSPKMSWRPPSIARTPLSGQPRKIPGGF